MLEYCEKHFLKYILRYGKTKIAESGQREDSKDMAQPNPSTCPRCGAPLFQERDMYGAYKYCIICSYMYEPESLDPTELLKEEQLNL